MPTSFSQCASWIELSKKAFENNVKNYRKELGPHQLLGGVLKGNAYGHGFNQVVELLHTWLDVMFVINPVDAFEIRSFERKRDMPAKRIVVLGCVSLQEAVQCAQLDIEVVIDGVHWEKRAQDMQAAMKSNPTALRCHIHIDTGLGREGFTLENLAQKISFLKKSLSILKPMGIMSHFSNVEDVTNQDYAESQIKNFDLACDIATRTLNLDHHLERHIGQSASTMIIPESRYDLVRVGISLYGLWSSSETKLSAKVTHPVLPALKPALSWKCTSQLIKSIQANSYIGYGCSYKAPHDLRIGLLPVGYFDGYPRMLSNKAHVLVNGHQCKVLGRVMMNHIVVDVTDATQDESPVVATLIGSDGSEVITVEQIAGWAETINYEVVTRIGPHLKRLVVD